MACIVRICDENTRGKALLCPKHWQMIPETLREEIRKGTEKGTHTLRATPTREWVQAVSKYVGDVKNLNIYVDSTSKVKRKFEKKSEEPATLNR
jgi:hypothetical protein